MSPGDVTDPSAVREAMRIADELGRDDFLTRYGFGRGRFYVVREQGREYDPKALVGVAYGVQFPDAGPLAARRFNGGVAGANAVLRRLGFAVEDFRPESIEAERDWREAAWLDLTTHPAWPELPPTVLRDVGIYGGQQGVWVDKDRTARLDSDGIAVSVLHTGRHYADDLDDTGIVYHYPQTMRPPSRDAGEIAAVKNCQKYQLPIFVISETIDGLRRLVQRAWVQEHDDPARIFLMRFGGQPPESESAPDDGPPFELLSRRRRSRREVERAERDPAFVFKLHSRYGSTCALTGISVFEMLEAAHIVPVKHGGSDHALNGLILSAGLHRAYDAWLWAIDPETLGVVVRLQGPSAEAMGMKYADLRHLANRPHVEALRWRHGQFVQRWNSERAQDAGMSS